MGKKSWCLGLFLLMAPLVLSIGIEGPILSPLIFEPGKEVKETYCIYNYNYDIKVSKGGDLVDLISLGPLIENKGKKCFELTIKFPEEIPKTGDYYTMIGAAEVGGAEGATVGTLTSITRNIKTVVYAKEKDIKLSLSTSNANENEKMAFNIGVQSWSYQDINKVKGKIDIYDEKKEKKASLETEEKSLKSKESISLTAEFDNTGLKPGDYRAEATVDYDGKLKTAESTFKIGTLDLTILNYTKEVSAGEINPFIIAVESNWNNPIDNIFGVLEINGEKVMKTPTTDIEAWGKKELKGYWEVGLEPGEYNGKIKLYFGKESKEEAIKMIVGERARAEQPSKFFDKTVFFLMSIIVLLVIILLILYWKKEK